MSLIASTRKKYQAHGTPHYHAVVWVEGAPVIGESPQKTVLKWINDRIYCRISEEKTNLSCIDLT